MMTRGSVRAPLAEDLLETPGFLVRGVVEAFVGDADGRDGDREEVGVAVAVVAECGAVVVELPGVSLDNQLVVGEVGVDAVASDLDVDERSRESVAAYER
jgi:hypothetical protein